MLLGLSSINATSENVTQDTISDDSSMLKTESNTNNFDYNTHVINTTTFNSYVENGLLNDKVSDGDTIDIQGKLDDPKFALNINKPVNIISSTADAYIDLDTHSTDISGGYRNGIFQVTSGGAGSNITGITFHNTRINISNTKNVHIDNITAICESNIGLGVGSFTIRDNSNNITVSNSYFKTFANGGHSNVVITGSQNCLIENNTIEGDGSEGIIGNLLYITTYGGGSSTNITIRNNTIRSFYTYGYGTCYGLALSGKGHIIENNYIDTSIPLKNQYAEAEYGVVTEVDSITFKNNIITYSDYNAVEGAHTPAEISFPGIVTNNTFYTKTTINQATVYNNTFKDTVTINNNVKFENNTANQVSVTGNNNTLNYNEIRSDEEYAVKITGENNTLTNNKLLSNNGYGEEAISNSTEYVSINNSEILLRVFDINDANIGDYFDFSIGSYGEYIYTMKDNIFNNGDILVFNITFDDGYGYYIQDTSTNAVDLIVENTTSILEFNFRKSLTIKNSFIWTYVPTSGANNKVTLINSTVGYWMNNGGSFYKDDDSSFISEQKYFLHNYYALVSENKYIPVLDKNGYLLDNVESFSTISVCKFNDEFENIYKDWGMSSKSLYCKDIYINKPLNFVAVPKLGIIGSNVHLIDGSTGTTFTGITFENDVIVESDNIKFINCTFNKNIELKNNLITLEGSTFYGNITLIASNNTVFNSNIVNSEDSISVVNSRNTIFENNTVTTTAGNTIVFDDESSNNIVRNNVLISSSLVGDDSVVAGDNDVYDNTPGYDTQIVIDGDSQAYVDDNLEVRITVNDLNNSKPVSKGYVEVYYSGYLIDLKDLTDGTTSVTIPVAEYIDDSDNYLKVWYYDGKRYNNNVTKKSISVVKSNVSIAVDEFTAKLNDKVEVTATFLNERGNPVGDTNVTFTVGRSTYTAQTDNGVATINELVTSEWLDAGKITIAFPNTDAYNSNTTTITLNTSKADIHITPTVSVEGSTANINLALTDELNSNVTDGRVTITTLDGTQLASGRVSNGLYTATVTIPDDYASEYLVANFTGSYYYNDLEYDVKLTAMLNSTITVVTNSPLYGEELVINGKLVDSKNTPIGGANLTLNLNGSKVIVTTNDDGEYNYTYTPGLGVNSLTVTFDGNSDIYGTSASKEVTIRDTDREMNEVLDRLDELQKENEKLLEQLEQLQEQLEQLREQNNKTADELNNIIQQNNELKEQLDNQTGNLTAQNEALQEQLNNVTQQNNATQEQLAALEEQNKELSDKLNNMTKDNEDLKEQLDNQTGNLTAQNEALQDQLDSINEQNEKLNDKLNDLLDLINQLNAPKDTVLTLDALDDAKYGDRITITGSLVDVGGNGVAGTVKLTINGGRATVVSDVSGTFTYDYVVTRMGLNNIMATYMGTDKYNPSNTSATVNVVEQDTNIVLDNMDAIRSGDNVVVSGQLVDANGKGVYGTVKLAINNGRATVKTDADGFFKYEKALSKVGVNNITAAYVASAKYNACNVTGTVDVTALGTNIVLDDIASVRSGENITISGKLLDENNKAIVGTIKLLINNGRATVKTNNNGEFTYTTSLTKVGSNNITVSYLGANSYTACNTTATVDVSVMDTVLVIDDVADAKKGDIIAVSGKLADANGNAVVGTVKLTINGGRATVKTDNDGVFVYDYTVTKAGLTNVTASYLGANRYGASSATSTVDVAKLATKITFNPLDSVAQKTSMNITGQLSDENDNGIYGTVKLLINNGRATVKTDKAGAFTYTFTPSKVGENTVTANYLESNNYEATETTTTFTVVKA